MSSSTERQAWLELAKLECVTLLKAVDVTVPDKVRVTIGWPSTGGRGKRIGECWSPTASTDAYGEIFISPRLTDTVTILGTLLHELIHAGVGAEAKHGPGFKRPAVAVGLEGKMTATTVGEALKATFKQWVTAHGEYPAGGLNLADRKKQTTRMLKAACSECGYTVRLAGKWLAEYGAPLCPNPEHEGHRMDADGGEDEEETPPPPPFNPVPPEVAKPAPEPPKAPEPSPPAREEKDARPPTPAPEAPKPPKARTPKPPKAKTSTLTEKDLAGLAEASRALRAHREKAKT